MKINDIKENKIKFNLSYTEKEQFRAFILAIISFFIIFIPVFLTVYELYFVFIMIPYFMATLCLIIAIILEYIYFLLNKAVLKSIRKVEGLNYFTPFIKEAIIIFIGIIIIYLVGILVLIPTFVL